MLEPTVIKPSWHQDPYAKARAARLAVKREQEAEAAAADEGPEKDVKEAEVSVVNPQPMEKKEPKYLTPVASFVAPESESMEKKWARRMVPVLLAFVGGSALGVACTRFEKQRLSTQLIEEKKETMQSSPRLVADDESSPSVSFPFVYDADASSAKKRPFNWSSGGSFADSVTDLEAARKVVRAGDFWMSKENAREAVAQYMLASERDSATLVGAEARKSLAEVLANRSDTTAIDWFLSTAALLKKTETRFEDEVDRATDMLLWSIKQNASTLVASQIDMDRARLALQLLDARVVARAGQVRLEAASETAARKALEVLAALGDPQAADLVSRSSPSLHNDIALIGTIDAPCATEDGYCKAEETLGSETHFLSERTQMSPSSLIRWTRKLAPNRPCSIAEFHFNSSRPSSPLLPPAALVPAQARLLPLRL